MSDDSTQTTLDAEDAIILDDAGLRSALEAVLLVVDTPVSVEELATATDQDRLRVKEMLTRMSNDLTMAGSGIDLRYTADGWRFYTRAEFAPYVERLLLDGARSKLTRAALETLAVIGYLTEELTSDPRFAKLGAGQAQSEEPTTAPEAAPDDHDQD